MNGIVFTRDLFAHCLIIAAVVVGGWVMLVEPRTQELSDLESAIAETSAGDVPLTQAGIEMLAARVEQVKSRIGDVKSRNELAHDSSRLYGAIMELGTQHNVLIERLRPGADVRDIAGGKATATRMDMTIKGEYETIARFLDDVLNMPGFMRPVSLSINPSSDGGQGVSVRLVCEALSFKMPEQLAVAQGGSANADS